MATLVLQTAGALIGNALGIPGGEMIGRAVGATLGAVVDAKVFGGAGSHSNGPRLASMGTLTSNEGAPIPRVYGRVRLGGEMIWATRFEEVIGKRRSTGGKGIGGGVSTKTYSYFANFAIGLCEGEIAFLRRIWADGKEIDLSTLTMRVYRGDETQEADPLIIAKEGATNAPAYRGLAYIVFERFPLADFGNRIPQMNFEIVRPVQGLAQKIRGVDLIPGASEFAYTPSFRSQGTSLGITRPENRHQLYAPSDWTGSIDALQALCPNLNSVALVVAWFGDDLRCGSCTIAPRVESQVKITSAAWAVDGLWRSTARLVSQIDGKPAYGGTPSDSCVIDAITDLKARGLSVVFYPFVMMDVAEGNTLTDPWTGASTQPAFPWRGRITCHPAPGQGGSVDATPTAATQVANFFGTTNPPANEWSYRRFILHYANLCQQAGGVSAFLMGSELAALTRVRSSASAYPAVAALTTLAGNVKAILGAGTKVSYAADWTEYGAHVLPNGDVRFPLDSLWSSSTVDFIGLDAYWPLSDWRDGTTHLDAQLARSIYDKPYLQSRMKAGEAYDFYYTDDAARLAQNRTPITDGTYNKPWIYRAKDIKNWWLNAHYERVAGVENTSPTSWVPQSKPIWLMEIGCPAIDRGANAPNVFPDAKSSQSALPPFSRGYRDDLMQVRALDAMLTHFDADLPGHVVGDNPVSTVYGARMVDAARTHIWAWDARPFPAFPDLSSVWSDAQNWQTGHWLNGRIEGMCVENLVDAVLDDCPAMQAVRQSTPIDGYVDGYVLDRQLSARGSLEPLAALFGFDAVLSGGQLRFAPRALSANITLTTDDLVPDKDGRLVTRTRQQESELPHEISLTFIDGDSDYREASVLSRRIEGFSKRETSAQMALITNRAEMKRLADITLQDVWVGRERAQFTVRPGLMALEIGDCVRLNVEGVKGLFRIEQISDGEARSISARAVEPTVFDRAPPRFERNVKSAPLTPGPARVEILDLAIARTDPTPLQYMAVFADPWAGSLAVYRATALGSYELVTTLTTPAIIGETLNDFHAGPVSHWDRANALHVRVGGGELSSVSEVEALAGRTAMAIKGTDGAWEIFAFVTAELVGEKTYRLSKLIRGMGGEEHLSQRMVPTGATVVLLDSAILPLSAGVDDLGASLTYRVGPANRDHGDASYVQVSTAPTTKALKPYAPVKVAAKRDPSGVMISFVRRGRRDADGWESLDIPLGETSENYRVEIWSGATLRRALTTSTPSVLYTWLAELFDFGAAQTSLHLKISQTSAAVGEGFVADVIVSVH